MKTMKKLSKRVLATLCTLALIAGCVLTYTGSLKEASSASTLNDEWYLFRSEEGTSITTSSLKIGKTISDAAIDLPETAQDRADLQLYVKVWLKDADAIAMIKTAVLEVANNNCDQMEVSWGFSNQTLVPGMNEITLLFSKATDYEGLSDVEGSGLFDTAQTINFCRIYTTTSLETDADSVVLYEIAIQNTNAAGLNFGQNDSHLQLTNTLTSAPETISASIKVSEEQNEWVLRKGSDTSWRSTTLAGMASYYTVEEEDAGPDVGTSYSSATMTAGTAYGFTNAFEIKIPEYYTVNDIALDFWFKTDVIESKMGYIDLTSAGTYADERLYFNMNTYLSDVVAGEWYHAVIPVSKGVQDTSNPNKFDLQGVDYLRWHSQTVQADTATFCLTDVKLVVLTAEETETNTATEWTLFEAGTELANATEYYYTNGTMTVPTITESGTVVAGENGPAVGSTYTQVDVTAGEKFGFHTKYKGLSSKIPNTGNFDEGDLAVEFWLYCSDASALPSSFFSLSSEGWNRTNAMYWTIKDFVTLKDGWNYVELRFDNYSSKSSAFDYTNILYAGLRPWDYKDATTGSYLDYPVTADCTLKMTDVKLVVRPDYNQEYNTLLKAGSTLDAAATYTATESEYKGSQVVSNGYITGEEASDFTPPEGTTYTQIDVAAGDYFCVRTSYAGIKETFSTTSRYDRSDLVISFWLYNESGVTLPTWSSIHLSSGGWLSASEEYLYLQPTASGTGPAVNLQQGWNYVEIPLGHSEWAARYGDSEVAFDYQNINFFQFYWKDTLAEANTFKITDIKIAPLKETQESKTLANIRSAREVAGGDVTGWWYTMGTKTLLQTTDFIENGPEVGTNYVNINFTSEATRYSLNNKFSYRVPSTYSIDDIALDLWVYASEDTTLSGGKQLMLHSVTSGTDSNMLYWKDLVGKTYSKGWNHLYLKLSDATQVGTFDLSELCYMRWHGNAISNVPVTLGFSDFKLVTIEEPYQVTVTEEVDASALEYNQMIFSNTNATDETSPYALYIDRDGQPTLLWGTTSFSLNYDVRTGTWTDIKVVRNEDQTVSFYIDDVLLATSLARNGLADEELTFATAHRIGADGSGAQLMVGRIANVMIYSDAEATACTGNWPLTGDIQYILTPMEDVSGHNNTAVYRGERAEDWIYYDKTQYDFLYNEEGEEDYWSMVFIPDIQNLTQTYYGYDQVWYETAQWIADNIETENIQHVIGAGDNSWSNWDSEYAIAKAGFDKFTDKVSWSNMSGNHEFDWGDDDNRTSTKFPNYFGLDYIESTKAAETYMGSFDDPQEMSTIENSYYRFQVNGVNWMILQLEYHPRLSVLEWAKEIAAKYPADNIIMTTHSYLDGSGNYSGHSKAYLSVGDGDQYLGNSMSKAWEELQECTNIKLILCGHSGNGKGAIARKTETNALGQSVQALMINAQDKDLSESGNTTAYYTDDCLGMISIIRFSADGSQAALQWYSPQWEKSYNPINLNGERDSCTIELSINIEAELEEFVNVTAGTAPASEEIPEGNVFAGWFTDNTCTTPLTPGTTADKAVAKFVDEDIMTAKVQFRLDENGDLPSEEEGTDMRFVTTVDTLNYSKVGFRIQCDTHNIDKTTETTRVYKSIYKVGKTSGDLDTLLPTELSPVSEYFLTWTLRGINGDGSYDVPITVTPYWVTQDGTTVWGTPTTKYVNQYNE